MTRVFPDLQEDMLLNLFHKGAKVQWTSRDLDWSEPVRMTSRERIALARLLTPVYFGEQSAMAGASNILPQLMAAGETTAQLYLASFIMDEARHFESLTRLFRQLGHHPLELREMPELLRYHNRIRKGDRADWVWGIAFSDVIAKHFYRVFGVAQADPLFGEMSRQILKDESRHLAFADQYLRRNVPRMDQARRRALVDLRDDLFRILQSMTEHVRADSAVFGVDADEYLSWVWTDVEKFGRRLGIDTGDGTDRTDGTDANGGAGAPVEAGRAVAVTPPRRPSRKTSPAVLAAAAEPAMARCFGCLISLLCGRRLVPA